MMGGKKWSIPTEYKGIQMRSKLENGLMTTESDGFMNRKDFRKTASSICLILLCLI